VTDSLQTVIEYHQRTKHHLDRYAEHLGYFDWDNQPDPFRTYAGSDCIALDFVEAGNTPRFDAIYDPTSLTPQPFNRSSVSQLFYDSLALSAWKEHIDRRWALRCNPSSGNLHPTEGYLIAPPVDGLTSGSGLYHYTPYHHALEVRAKWDNSWRSNSIFVGLSTIYWRESWKYGERAFRYCHHDMGHAIGAVAIAASLLGWKTRVLRDISDSDLAGILAVSDQRGPEAEHAEVLLQLTPHDRQPTDPAWPAERAQRAAEPNRLSAGHHPWPVIDQAGEATARNAPGPNFTKSGSSPRLAGTREVPARKIVRKRRSAYEMDGKTTIPRDEFYRCLHAVMPCRPPFSTLWWKAEVHLALHVHRVEGIAPGCYVLLRDESVRDRMAADWRPEFAWERLDTCPENLPFYLLAEGDFREEAKKISCHQDIAADGVFALAMIASFREPLEHHGPWFYKNLHWESGLIGQVLYLEAEAAGIRSTGIGCYFDDATHEVLGIQDATWQSLYHFTVGGPVVDLRLRTIQAYAHVKDFQERSSK
jgi:SagB-type dehydrogenase family enzyme